MKKLVCFGLGLVASAFTPLQPARAEVTPPTEASPDEVGHTEGIIARVNGEPIYQEDLEQILGSLHTGQTYQQRQAFDPSRLVDRAIDDELLAQEARSLGLQQEEPIPTQLARYRESLAIELLNRREIAEKVQVTDQEVRESFENFYKTATFHIVTLEDPEEAAALHDEIDETTDFSALARERSVDHYRLRGGFVEDLTRFDMPREVARAVFAAEPGTLIGPVSTAKGYALLRVESTSPADPERYAALEGGLRDLVWNQKAARRKKAFAAEVRQHHTVEIFDEVLAQIEVEELNYGRLVPTVEDRQAIVARVDDREIDTEMLGAALWKRWKGVKNQEAAVAVKPFVLQTLVNEELLKAEAARRGYGQESDVERKLRARERELLIVNYIEQFVTTGIEVSEEETRILYDENKERFKRPPRLHLGQITVASREEADRLAEQLRQGTDLAWLARQHSIDRFRDSGGAVGWMVPAPGVDSYQDTLAAAQVGEVIGPRGVPGNFILVRINAREEQGIYSFEEMQRRLRSQIFVQKRNERTQEVLAKLRSSSEIQVYEEALAQLMITGEQSEDQAKAPVAH